ncbi:MAG TPA: hypothetical protein VHG91_07260 [Longimicrobium sp.]|nr:hypothetical protein [Longimicrobium sp.]
MRKIKLELDTLAVQSFETSPVRGRAGTVLGHDAPSNGGGPNCNSAIDACPTGFCATISPDQCPTYFPEYCESADDACPSGRGCTEIDC